MPTDDDADHSAILRRRLSFIAAALAAISPSACASGPRIEAPPAITLQSTQTNGASTVSRQTPTPTPTPDDAELTRDSDADGVLDRDDRCPDEPGTPDERQGCPPPRPCLSVLSEIRILERVEFTPGSVAIRAESAALLDAIGELLRQRAALTTAIVGDCAPGEGAVLANIRAKQVQAALVTRGVDAARIPIRSASSCSAEGSAKVRFDVQNP